MILYYDLLEEKWFHTKENRYYTFGVEEVPLSYQKKPTSSSIPFLVSCRENRNLGPLVGIMAGRKNESTIVGNGSLFKKIQENLLDNGGISIVFTPEDVRENEVKGLLYIPNKKRWISVKIPSPHIVYNRLPYRRMEETEAFKSAIRLFKEKDVCFFNPFFLDKYDVYLVLKEETFLKRYIPETSLVSDKRSFEEFLNKHNPLYVKPSNSSKGKGIFTVTISDTGTILVKDYRKEHVYQNFDDFWDKYHLLFKKKSYIIQQAISPLLQDGKRYDFRILAHFDGDKHVVTGVGVRQSVEQNITTHIPNGGKLISFDDVEREADRVFIQKIVQKCGIVLAERFGFFGEFSIDAGLTENNEYVIYEINSKPMSFDEQKIEMARIRSLSQLFMYFF